MKEWISDKWGYLLYPVYLLSLVLIIWLSIKFDLGENAYDQEGNPDDGFYRQYNGR